LDACRYLIGVAVFSFLTLFIFDLCQYFLLTSLS
jgi:hypothetical protein